MPLTAQAHTAQAHVRLPGESALTGPRRMPLEGTFFALELGTYCHRIETRRSAYGQRSLLTSGTPSPCGALIKSALRFGISKNRECVAV